MSFKKSGRAPIVVLPTQPVEKKAEEKKPEEKPTAPTN